jgi:hypothetical protein
MRQTDTTVRILSKELSEISQRYTYAQSLDDGTMPGDLSEDNLEYILRRYFWTCAFDGNLDPVNRHLTHLPEALTASNNNYYLRRGTLKICAVVFDGFLWGLATANDRDVTPRDLQLAKSWYRSFAKVDGLDDKKLKLRAAALPFGIHALAGKSKEFDQWARSLTEAEQSLYLSALEQGTSLATTWTDLSYWNNDDRSESRLRYLKALVRDPFSFEMLYARRNAIWEAYRSGLVANEPEYWQATADVPDSHPHSTQIRFERALGRAWASQEGAYSDMQATLKETIEQGDEAMEQLVRAELVAIMGERQGQSAKAVAMFESIDWEKFPMEGTNEDLKKFATDHATRYREELKNNEQPK